MLASSEVLANQFLISMPHSKNPVFSDVVIYLLWHGKEGAAGLIVNRPTELSVQYIFDQLGLAPKKTATLQAPVLFGGPVGQERGFVIHRPMAGFEPQFGLEGDVAVSTSHTALQCIADGKGPEDCMFVLGYAGWAPNQLDQELQNNIWLTGPLDSEILFGTAYEERWHNAVKSIGVHPEQYIIEPPTSLN